MAAVASGPYSVVGPSNGPEDTLTNRIQKELVKQLVYSAKPKTLRYSRFNRIVPLRWWRALLEGAGLAAGLWFMLFLIQKLPAVVGTGDSQGPLRRIVAWAILGAMLAVAYAVLRKLVYSRFIVSDLSAGGATVKLSERTTTYFDEYMDEIVHYFDTESPDIVVFEDLDRFNDPNIFEALREVNITLNRTAYRRDKKVPLRFVYAVRDSLFEQLGADTTADRRDADDAAAAETVRANRTKFFDVVVPIVPFISHRNARELLAHRLAEANITGIEKRLVGLIAQHCTDMRLLTNICNEYLLFAERLLDSDKLAPGLNANKLFALVAFKNFHPGDFENIARSTSDLDAVNDLRREMVRTHVRRLEAEKRAIGGLRTEIRTRAGLAERLATRLRGCIRVAQAATQYKQFRELQLETADGAKHKLEELDAYAFWVTVAQGDGVKVTCSPSPPSWVQIFTLKRQDLMDLVPEAFEAGRWEEFDETAARRRTSQIADELAFLRGADFAALAGAQQYTLPTTTARQGRAIDGNDDTPDLTFAELIDQSLKSNLARELVKRGHIDRNYTLYAAQFYGTFVGVDVATFIVQNVQTNTMEVDYTFTSPGAVPNLLHEVDEDFTHTVAAYNNEVLDYLLESEDPRGADILSRLVSDQDEDARSFMASYFTSGQQRTRLAAELAASRWSTIFTYLVSSGDIPDDDRPALVSAALIAAVAEHSYNLDDPVRHFITDHYREMDAFTRPQDRRAATTVAHLLEAAGVELPELDPVASSLLDLVIANQQYDLNAPNLRVAIAYATGEQAVPGTSVSLDQIRDARHAHAVGAANGDSGSAGAGGGTGQAIYDFCLRHPARYLDAVEADSDIPFVIHSQVTLASILTDIAPPPAGYDSGSERQPGQWVEHWDGGLVARLLAMTDPQATLERLDAVPPSLWRPLAEAKLFSPTLANVDRYRAEIGSIDGALGSLLAVAGTITHAGAGTRVEEGSNGGSEVEQKGKVEPDRAGIMSTSVAILNARSIATDTRVRLVCGLSPALPLPVADIAAESGDLFARLLAADVIPDDEASFEHFRDGGWAAIGPAIAVSKRISDFQDLSRLAGIVRGMVAELLTDSTAADRLGSKIVENVDVFVPDIETDAAGLAAVAAYAERHSIPVTPQTVARVAATQLVDPAQALSLLNAAQPAAKAQDIVAIFQALGDPYGQILTSGNQFTLPKDCLHEPVLTALKDANVVELKKRRLHDVYDVTVR